MKKNNNAILIFICILACTQFACKKQDIKSSDSSVQNAVATPSRAVTNAELIAYKATSHELAVGFYRTWRDRTVSANFNDPIMTDLPDSLDIAIVFRDYTPANSTFWTKLKDVYIPALHAKGTKVLYTGSLDIPSVYANDAAKYAKTAKYIMDSIVNKFGFDGYDIDIEYEPSGSDLADKVGVYKALGAYLGPKSGTKKLLTFDTNKSASNSMFQQVYSYISYVFLQVYGQGTANLQSYFTSYGSYIKSYQLVYGFSFYEENGYPDNYWDDVNYPRNGTGRAYEYAKWEPSSGLKGGVLSYAIDRDAALTSMHDNAIRKPDFKVTKDLIQIMNPVGVALYESSSYQGAFTKRLPKGSYTLATLKTNGFVDNWASSMVVPSGWTVTMYSNDNYSGTSWNVTSNTSAFTGLSPSANDLVTSIKIQ